MPDLCHGMFVEDRIEALQGMGKSKPIIGLCGGIGSGKSLVAREFERLGCLLVDSDRLNQEVLDRPEVARQLEEWWGPTVRRPDGRVSRHEIARIVFTDASERVRLESLTHPLIAARREDMISSGFEDPAVRAIILDSPLLLESQLDRRCDAVVFVEADESQRTNRVRDSRGWDIEELRRRERWQLPLDQKRSRADFVVDNRGGPEALPAQVSRILEQVVARHAAT